MIRSVDSIIRACLSITVDTSDDTGQPVAIKLEHNSIHQLVPYAEADHCRTLAGRLGIPQVYWDGEEYIYNAIVFE